MKATLCSILLLLSGGVDYDKLLKDVSFPMTEAIDKAMKAAKDGAVVSSEIEEEDGGVRYTFDIAQGDKTREIGLDVKDGKVVEDIVEAGDKSALVKAAKITLKQAVEAALLKVKGTAVAAAFVMKKTKVTAKVTIVADGKASNVYVKGDGKVSAVKDAATDEAEAAEGAEAGEGKEGAEGKEAAEAKEKGVK